MRLARPCLFVLVGLLLGCQEGSVVPMPQELLGVWRTEDPVYLDSYLEITRTSVQFGKDTEPARPLDVEEVRLLEGESGEPVYRIKYLSTEGLEYLLQIEHSSASSTLRLVNQSRMKWTRVKVFER